jgi:hypothetical protein
MTLGVFRIVSRFALFTPKQIQPQMRDNILHPQNNAKERKRGVNLELWNSGKDVPTFLTFQRFNHPPSAIHHSLFTLPLPLQLET